MKLTKRESLIFEALKKSGYLTRSEINAALGLESFSNTIDVHIMRIRKELPENMKIVSIRGSNKIEGGYKIEIK